MPNGGKAKSLDWAIHSALCVGPFQNVMDRAHGIFYEFLSEKFGAAMSQHPECKDVLKELFDSIVKRDKTHTT